MQHTSTSAYDSIPSIQQYRKYFIDSLRSIGNIRWKPVVRGPEAPPHDCNGIDSLKRSTVI